MTCQTSALFKAVQDIEVMLEHGFVTLIASCCTVVTKVSAILNLVQAGVCSFQQLAPLVFWPFLICGFCHVLMVCLCVCQAMFLAHWLYCFFT